MLYRVFDLVVDSEIPLLDFEHVPAGDPVLSVRVHEHAFRLPGDLVWADVWGEARTTAAGSPTPSAPVWRLARDGADLLISIPKCGEFRLENRCRTLICRSYSKTSNWALRSQLSYNIVPRILAELGHLVVHASCVSLDGGGSVLFMGPSGAGKSTLAASFVGNGGDLLSDDCVLLRHEGSLRAHVTGGVARLWEDSLTHLVGEHHEASLITRSRASRKWSHRIGPDSPIPASTRVDAIFHLSVDAAEAGVTMAEESGSRLLSVLTDATLLLDPLEKRNRRRRFVAASDVANACPAFYSLSYPRTFERLAEVRRAVVAKVLELRHVPVAR